MKSHKYTPYDNESVKEYLLLLPFTENEKLKTSRQVSFAIEMGTDPRPPSCIPLKHLTWVLSLLRSKRGGIEKVHA